MTHHEIFLGGGWLYTEAGDFNVLNLFELLWTRGVYPPVIISRPPYNNLGPPVIICRPPVNNSRPPVITWRLPHNNWWPRVINWSPPHNNWWSPVIIWWSLVIDWRPPHNNWWPRVINQWPPYNSWWPPVIMWWPRDNNWRIDQVKKIFHLCLQGASVMMLYEPFRYSLSSWWIYQCCYGRSTMLIISGGRIWNTHLATMLHTYEYLKNKTYC